MELQGFPCDFLNSIQANWEHLFLETFHRKIFPVEIAKPRVIRMNDTIKERCEVKGLRMTEQRRIIADVIEDSGDHPDVEALYLRASDKDNRISLATVYRTVKLFEEAGILDRLEFGDGRARYEDAERDHHDHLIDLTTGEVIEFIDPDIEALQEKIAKKYGYTLKGHRLELYGVRRRGR